MANREYDASPQELRVFAFLQVLLTIGFLAALFVMLGGFDADQPHWLVSVGLLASVVVCGFQADRVWLSATPLDPGADPQENRSRAIAIYANQTIRKLTICGVPMILAVVVAIFFVDAGGWPILIAGIPGLAVTIFEVWPSLRNVSMTATMLDSNGAKSELIDSFV